MRNTAMLGLFMIILPVTALTAGAAEKIARIEGNDIVLYECPAMFGPDGRQAPPLEVKRVPRNVEIDPRGLTEEQLADTVIASACNLYTVARYLEPVLTGASTLPMTVLSVGVPGFATVRLGYTREHGLGFYWYSTILPNPSDLKYRVLGWVDTISDETREVHLKGVEVPAHQPAPLPFPQSSVPSRTPRLAL